MGTISIARRSLLHFLWPQETSIFVQVGVSIYPYDLGKWGKPGSKSSKRAFCTPSWQSNSHVSFHFVFTVFSKLEVANGQPPIVPSHCYLGAGLPLFGKSTLSWSSQGAESVGVAEESKNIFCTSMVYDEHHVNCCLYSELQEFFGALQTIFFKRCKKQSKIYILAYCTLLLLMHRAQSWISLWASY